MFFQKLKTTNTTEKVVVSKYLPKGWEVFNWKKNSRNPLDRRIFRTPWKASLQRKLGATCGSGRQQELQLGGIEVLGRGGGEILGGIFWRGWSCQPNSRGLCIHYIFKDFLSTVGWPSPIEGVVILEEFCWFILLDGLSFLDLPKNFVLWSFLNPKIFDMYASCFIKWAKILYWIGGTSWPWKSRRPKTKVIVPWDCWWNISLTKKQMGFCFGFGPNKPLLFSKGLFHSENRSLKDLQGWRLVCLTWKYCGRPWPVPLGRKLSHLSICMPWKSCCRLLFEWYFCKDFGFSKGLDSSTISRDYTFNGRLDFQGYVVYVRELMIEFTT